MYLAATQTRTHAHIHTRTLPPLLSYPVAMEPVAKAERYVVVMDVVDEGDDDNDDDDDVHEDDDGGSGIISPFAEFPGPAGLKL